MTEQIQAQDPRELVGYPRTPLRKLSRGERSAVKKIVKDAPHDIDPVMALRMALSSGTPVRPEWLQAAQIDLALETDDILRNLDKLTPAKRVLNATQVVEVLSRRMERAPGVVLRALSKLTLPKTVVRGLAVNPMLDRDTTLWTIRLATSLVAILLQNRPIKTKKPIHHTLLEIVYVASESWPVPEVAIRGLEFLRAFERHVGWSEIEKAPLEKMRNAVLGLPACIIPELLERGALGEATLLSERVKLSEPAERLFKAAVNEVLSSEKQISLQSKNWGLRLLQSDEAQESASLASSDAAYERLALVLINAWEARGDGTSSAHAFAVSEEIFRNGFSIHMGGEVGSSEAFDPDVHEGSAEIHRGSLVRLIRPWVELKNANEVKILIKGRVTVAG